MFRESLKRHGYIICVISWLHSVGTPVDNTSQKGENKFQYIKDGHRNSGSEKQSQLLSEALNMHSC